MYLEKSILYVKTVILVIYSRSSWLQVVGSTDECVDCVLYDEGYLNMTIFKNRPSLRIPAEVFGRP